MQGCGPGSVVGIATGYGVDGPGIDSRWGRNFPNLSRPALRPTQAPIQWVQGLSRGGGDADPSPPSSAVVKREELYLFSPYGSYGLYRASVPVQGCALPFLLLPCKVRNFVIILLRNQADEASLTKQNKLH